MSFQALSVGTVAAGLLALAGVLYLLQRLRVRHAEQVVVTTLFWKEAVEDTRARVLVERFRHPLAYLVALALCSLLWLAAADPRQTGAAERDVVLLLDGSSGMAFGTRFAEARAAVQQVLADTPARSRRVILCADEPRTILLAGEEALLLDERLAGIGPVAAPGCLEAEVWRLARLSSLERPVDVLVFGDAPIDEDALALLPDTATVSRVECGEAETRLGNRGITALGVSGARSGAWNRVDALVEVRGEGSADAPLSVLLGGQPWSGQAVRAASAGGTAGVTRVLISDLPASGDVLTVRLAPDAFELDDEAILVLPERPLIRIAVSPDIPAALSSALISDPAVVLVTSTPDVVVRRAGDAFGADVPALELTPVDDQGDSILVHHSAGDESYPVLERAFDALGLAEIDATGLADVAGRPITVGAVADVVPGIDIWEELLLDEYNFTRSRAFPLFVAGAVRWLAGSREFLPFVSAGEAVAGRAVPHVDETGASLDPLGASFTPPRAGRYDSPAATPIDASLFELDLTAPLRSARDEDAAIRETAGSGGDLVTWLALAALLLLLVEWHLFRTGRMP